MRLKTTNGKSIYKNCEKYKIDWEKNERSHIQKAVKDFLKPFIKNHIVFAEFPVFGTKLKLDLFDATSRICYETNGRQHTEYVPFFHKNRSAFLAQIKRDMKKHKWCEENDIILVEIE